MKFTIDGLTVSNAAIKQTDSKTVVLTTSVQEGGKQYTVKSGDKVLGKFVGVSAVIPSKVELTSDSLSQQGITGQQVTIKAQVTVAEGQSKAGIPVTFNVKAATGSFNDDQVKEVVTNAEGIATYTYTQYSKGEDVVTAYATGDASKRDTGAKVYWGAAKRLTVSEVTEGNTLVNGAKKVYKVSSPEYAGKYVNVAFKENIGVTPDKSVRGVKVTDKQYGGDYPYQYTTGGHDYVQVKLDSNGNATFTLSGTDSKVTPIVFISEAYEGPTASKPVGSSDYNALNKYTATAMQATAPTVSFEAVQSFAIKVESQGVANAAKYLNDDNRGGRSYKATVTTKDGKLAPKGTTVYVVVPADKLDSKKKVWLVDQANPTTPKPVTGDQLIPLTTNAKGEVDFTLIGEENAFATPVVMQDNGSVPNKLDKGDLQTTGEVVYFGKAYVEKATLEVLDSNDNPVTSVLGNGTDVAKFVYQSVDQNGNPYTTGTTFITSFQVTAGWNDITTSKGTVTSGDTKTFEVTSDANGTAVLTITSGKVSSANVRASAAQTSLPILDASVSFTDSKELPAKYTGIVTGINDVNKTIKLGSYDSVSYAKSTFKNANGVALDLADFEKLVKANLNNIKVTAVKDANGVYSFEVVSVNETVGNAVKAINSATTLKEIEDALASSGLTPAFSQLNSTQKNNVATDVQTARNNAGYQLTEAGLKAAYTASYKAEVDAAIAAVEAGATAANLADVPGLDLTEYNNVPTADKATVNGNIDAAITALPAAAPGANKVATVSALKTIVDKAIADYHAGKNTAAVTAAITAVNAAADGAAIKTSVLDSATHVAALKLDLTGLSSTQLSAIADELFANKGAGYQDPIAFKAEFDKAVKKATDKDAPTVTAVELNGNKLVLTFSEPISIGTADKADFTYTDGNFPVDITGASVATVANSDDKIEITVAAGSSLAKGHKITALKLYNNGAASTTIDVVDTAIPTAHKFVFASDGYEVK